MKLSRHARVVAALIALAGLLFVQLGVAAYTCPKMHIGHAMEQLSMSAAPVSHMAMDGCSANQTQPMNCQPQAGPQSLDTPNLPPIAPFVAVTFQGEIVDSGSMALPSLAARADAPYLSRTTSPPLSIQNCCFRI
nr:hypothetical protein [uncultured Duganella sp.]